MLKTSMFRLQIVCPGCNNFVAVSGITDFDTCQNCGKKINVLSIINDKMFGILHKEKYMNGFLSGGIEQIGGTGAYKLEYSSMQPYCEECYTVIEENTALEAIRAGKVYECSNCRHKMPVRAADVMLKEFHPKAAGVLNDSWGIDRKSLNTNTEEMLVFKCITCGAGLELTGETKRTIKCGYCDNENYLPDSIWTKLHPNKEVQPLFIILDLDESDIKGTIDYFVNVTALNIYSRHFDNFIKEYFQRPFISESLLVWVKFFVSAKNNEQVNFNMDITKSHKYFYDNLKLGLSTHPAELKITVAENGRGIPLELQTLLAEDKNETIRVALAKNTGINKNIIKKLQSDTSPSVRETAEKQKTGLFSRLFG